MELTAPSEGYLQMVCLMDSTMESYVPRVSHVWCKSLACLLYLKLQELRMKMEYSHHLAGLIVEVPLQPSMMTRTHWLVLSLVE